MLFMIDVVVNVKLEFPSSAIAQFSICPLLYCIAIYAGN